MTKHSNNAHQQSLACVLFILFLTFFRYQLYRTKQVRTRLLQKKGGSLITHRPHSPFCRNLNSRLETIIKTQQGTFPFLAVIPHFLKMHNDVTNGPPWEAYSTAEKPQWRSTSLWSPSALLQLVMGYEKGPPQQILRAMQIYDGEDDPAGTCSLSL